jgi:hypothetical protein
MRRVVTFEDDEVLVTEIDLAAPDHVSPYFWCDGFRYPNYDPLDNPWLIVAAEGYYDGIPLGVDALRRMNQDYDIKEKVLSLFNIDRSAIE